MLDLKTAKKIIKAVSADELLNSTTLVALNKESDCFGKIFDPKNNYCLKCNILMELEGRREELSVFCKELSEAVTAKTENIQEEEPMVEQAVETGDVKEEEVKVEEAKVEEVMAKESRPKMLARKKAAGMTLEQCLEDPELLAKYTNKKAWIKNDFSK
jgi:hypothetical protein